MQKLEYVMIFEEFDADQFMENPESGFTDNEESPEIVEGDYVSSYRGSGQILAFVEDFAIVQLEGSEGKKVKVPRSVLTKIKREKITQTVHVDVDTELEKIAQSVMTYLNILEDDSDAINFESAHRFMQDILVDVIDLQRKDADLISRKEFDIIWHGIVNLGSRIVTISPEMKDQIDTILAKFEMIGEKPDPIEEPETTESAEEPFSA